MSVVLLTNDDFGVYHTFKLDVNNKFIAKVNIILAAKVAAAKVQKHIGLRGR